MLIRSCVLCASLLAFGALASCVEQQPSVNRVQPNVIAKTAFEGEWYYLQTVIDTPYNATYTFVGDQALLEKITWEIQEDLLIARRSYEFIAESEGDGIRDRSEIGAAVAIYAIEKHFDVRREYNPTTGEAANVVEENDYDRPWYEREYMRVDWSANLITEPEFLSYARLFDGMVAEPVAYYIEDPNHPDAPQFVTNDEGETEYIDIVNKVFVEPGNVYIDGWGEYPVCWLEYSMHVDCASTELTIRHSFRRADIEDRDYEALDYSGDRMEQFGYFVNERPGYDRDYGVIDPLRYRFINRHNIWQASHRSENGELVTCIDDEDCDDVPGSYCDIDLARVSRSAEAACTIPFQDRRIRRVAYHVSEEFPEEFYNDAEFVAEEWNDAFEETVDSLRENECLLAGGGEGECFDERGRRDATSIFVLCHNPVAAEDDEACGEEGTVARIGDLRYSLLAWVPEPHSASPLGYGPSAADPETGELIQANAFMYGAAVDELAAYARDIVGLLMGDLDAEEISGGATVDYFRTSLAPSSTTRHVIPYHGGDAERLSASMDLSRIAGSRRGSAIPRPTSHAEFINARSAAIRSLSRRNAFGAAPEIASARMHSLVDSPIETMLTGPDLRAAAGVDPSMPLSDSILDVASPLRGMSLSRQRALERARRQLRAARCVLHPHDFSDDGLLGLAERIREIVEDGDGTWSLYGRTYTIADSEGLVDYDALREALRHLIYVSTATHEVGHTLGLRHNFGGSYDALNYHRRYWDLRNDGTMRPRAWDPLTEEEIVGGIREYQYSTVMDYGNNFVVTDAYGIGHYDRAAIKMGYGDLVEVFESASEPGEIAAINMMQRYGYPAMITSDSWFVGFPVRAYAYTDIPDLVHGVDSIENRVDVPYSTLEPDPALEEEGVDLLLVDAMGRPAVPYRFCSDEISDLAPDCLLYDAGADQYETLQSVIDTYWHYYVFSHFRRQRLGFDVGPVWERIYGRYFAKLVSANQDYVFTRAWLDEMFAGDESLDEFYTREDGLGAYTIGNAAAFSLFTRVITTPEPGSYVEDDRLDGSGPALFEDYSEEEDEAVELDDGRFLQTTWNFDAGYYWFDQLERVGFFFDKILAIQSLLDPETNILGEDSESDSRAFQINYASLYPEATAQFLSGIVAEDWDRISPRASADGLLYPDPEELISGDVGGVPFDPNAGFSLQLWASVFGMTLIPATYDDLFLEQSRIALLGGPESVFLAEEQRVTFVDPMTNLTYAAASYPDGNDNETGLGARMLLHAQALLDAGEMEALDEYMDLIRVVRSLSWEVGFL